MSGPARVLWLAKGLGLGGTERLMAGSLRHLDASRFQVEVAYVLPWKDALVPAVEAEGVRVHCLGRGRYPVVTSIRRLRRLLRDGAFDIVHTHMPQPAVAARLLLGGHRRPALVHTEHNLWERYRWLTRQSNALTYGRNRAVIAVSEAVARSVTPRWASMPRPVEVVLHGVDHTAFAGGAGARSPARARLGIDPDALVVGSVGNFTAKKDQKVLLSAIAHLVPSHPGLRLVLIGSGPLEKELRAHAHDLGVGAVVTFTGARQDVPEILPGFDVFALSSRHEGLPIALLEAMASGLPCVATRVGGTPEVVDDGVEGFLVEPGDAALLAGTLGKLLDDPVLRREMGERASRRSRQYGLERAVRRTQDIYDEVLAGTSPVAGRR